MLRSNPHPTTDRHKPAFGLCKLPTRHPKKKDPHNRGSFFCAIPCKNAGKEAGENLSPQRGLSCYLGENSRKLHAMRGFNHIAGGLAFTGIFASFADVNLFEKPQYVGACVFFSLLPDIDHTRSTIGKAFYPIAKMVDRKYGHRTVTHCFLFFVGVVALVGLLERLLTSGRTLTGIAALALGSHLLFDMCTRQGVPLFLPFTRARCVLPGNPNMRLSSKSPLAEVVVFLGFCLLLTTTLPLMANGFWATVNNEFATFDHVQRELDRKPDILYLETKEGQAGQVVSATDEATVIYNGRGFVKLDPKTAHPLRFKHTGKPRGTQRLEFVAIDADSLRQIVKLPLIALKATCTVPIRYRIDGQQYEQTTLALDYPAGFVFSVVAPDNTATEQRLLTLRAQVAEYDAASRLYQQDLQMYKMQIDRMSQQHAQLSEYDQGRNVEDIAKAKALLAATKAPDHAAARAIAVVEINRLKSTLKGQKPTFTGVATLWKP